MVQWGNSQHRCNMILYACSHVLTEDMIIARDLITIISTCYQVIPKKSMSLVDIAECSYHLAKFLRRRRRSQSIGGCKATDKEYGYRNTIRLLVVILQLEESHGG